MVGWLVGCPECGCLSGVGWEYGVGAGWSWWGGYSFPPHLEPLLVALGDVDREALAAVLLPAPARQYSTMHGRVTWWGPSASRQADALESAWTSPIMLHSRAGYNRKMAVPAACARKQRPRCEVPGVVAGRPPLPPPPSPSPPSHPPTHSRGNQRRPRLPHPPFPNHSGALVSRIRQQNGKLKKRESRF